jgi:hypothetical protein
LENDPSREKTTLNRVDYVRVKIAAKDVSKIPEFAEGAILPYLCDFFYEREVVLEEKKEINVVLVNVEKMNPKKLYPQKIEMFELSVQIAMQKDVGKSVVEECNAKQQQVDCLTSSPMDGLKSAPISSRNPDDRLAKKSLVPQSLKPMLMLDRSD